MLLHEFSKILKSPEVFVYVDKEIENMQNLPSSNSAEANIELLVLKTAERILPQIQENMAEFLADTSPHLVGSTTEGVWRENTG